MGVGGGLVQPGLLRPGRIARSARTGRRTDADRARWIMGERRALDAPVRVPSQGAAGHIRLQRRIPHRLRTALGLVAIGALLVSTGTARAQEQPPIIVTTGTALVQRAPDV